MKKESVDINDLALHLGLSKATVSRALNGYGDISEKTKARVAAAAEQLGYRPSTSARRLALRQTETIGLVLPPDAGEVSGIFLTEFTAALADGLSPEGFDLLIHSSLSDPDPLEGYRRLVEARKVDGFVVIRTREQDPRVDWLLEQRIPFVAHGRTARAAEHAWFDIDGEAAFREATEHLIGLRHRRIAMITGGNLLYSSALREAGFRGAMQAAGLPVPDAWVLEGDLSGHCGFTRGQELFRGSERPTAVVCVNDATAFGVIKAARHQGLQVPQQVSVLGYDGVALGDLFDPPLTTMTRSIDESGRVVAQALLSLIRGGNPCEHQSLQQAELLQRASIGPAP